MVKRWFVLPLIIELFFLCPKISTADAALKSTESRSTFFTYHATSEPSETSSSDATSDEHALITPTDASFQSDLESKEFVQLSAHTQTTSSLLDSSNQLYRTKYHLQAKAPTLNLSPSSPSRITVLPKNEVMEDVFSSRRLEESSWDFSSFLFDLLESFNLILPDWIADFLCSVLSLCPPSQTTNDFVISNFTVEYDVELNEFNGLLDVPAMRSAYEVAMAGMLNVDAQAADTSFYSFLVDEDASSSKKNRRQATATGVCKKKKCEVPSSYSFPSRKHDVMSMSPEELSIFEALKNTPYAPPVLQYQLEKNREESSITYDASFQTIVEYPWSTYSGVSTTEVPGSLISTPTSLCKVNEDECATQRAAISSVFNSLQVEYNETEQECLWEGVLCNDLNLITELQIENISPSSYKKDALKDISFPIGITDLTSLSKLSFNNVGMVGTIPKLDTLTELQVISLENNKLTGTIPSELGVLRKMKTLILAKNNLFGGIPSELGDLGELIVLDLGQNADIRQNIPPELGNLIKLITLKLNDCSLTSVVPESFQYLTSVKEIIMSGNDLEGSIDIFSSLINLSVLQLDNNRFTGSIPDLFRNLVELSVFTLYGNQIAGAFPAFLGNLPLLTDLILGKNDITGSIPSEIGKLKNLKNFDVANCEISGGLPSEMGNLDKLEVLNVVRNTLNATIPSELGQLGSLESLILANNLFVGPIPTELGLLSTLEAIDVGENDLTGTIPTELNNLENLEDISLGDNEFTGDIGFLCDSEYVIYNPDDFPGVDCSTGQEAAVTELFDALGLTDYNIRSRASVCEWTGIECNDKDSVVGINLVGRGLAGTLSAAIGKIYDLETIDLSNNALNSVIPKEISTLKFLKSVILTNNDFTGDASFFCGVAYVVELDVGEVDTTCTTQPSMSTIPSMSPSAGPSFFPSTKPSNVPSLTPSVGPSDIPSMSPSAGPSFFPSTKPSNVPSSTPSVGPSNIPSMSPSAGPSTQPSLSTIPSSKPSISAAPTIPVVWNMYGVELEGSTDSQNLGKGVAFSRDGTKLWVGGKGYLQLYVDNGTGWIPDHDLSSGVNSNVKTICVSVDGNTVAVGENLKYVDNRGGVSVFNYDGSSWVPKGQTVDGEADWNNFGNGLAINGDGTMFVASAHKGEYVKAYEFSSNSWNQLWKINGDPDSFFGKSLCMSDDGTRMIVGAYFAENNGYRSGSVYFYEVSSSNATLFQQENGASNKDTLGHSVTISADGTVVAAGTFTTGNYVILYRADDNTRKHYTQFSTNIVGADRGISDKYGWSAKLASNGRRLVVGAPQNDDGGTNAGKAFFYTIHANNHTKTGEVLGEDEGDGLGEDLAISADGKLIAVGAYQNKGNDVAGINRGHVRVYKS